MRKLLSLIVICLTLQGCVAFLAGAASGGAIVFDRRNLDTRIADSEISHQIRNQIYSDKAFLNSHITVSTFNHVVLLAGQTPQPELRSKAASLAWSIKKPEIKRIYNEIQVAGKTTGITRSNDVWITTKIRTQMLMNTDLEASQIKVVTENSDVFLMGTVNKHQAQLAVDVARNVAGVAKVIKLFEYKNL